LSASIGDKEAAQARDGCLVFSVGVTGHRDCDPAAAAQVRALLEAELRRLQRICAAMPIELVTGLAEGADTIATEVALDLGLPVRAVLPMPRLLYEVDFSGEALERFRRLADDPRIQVDEIPLPAGVTAEDVREGAVRDVLYARLMNYLVRRSNVLVALWDGEATGLQGGTSDVVISYLAGSTDSKPGASAIRLQSDDGIADENGDFVIWIKTPRLSTRGSAHTIDISYLLSAGAGGLIAQRSEIPKSLLERWAGLQRYAVERFSDEGADVPAYPLSSEGDGDMAPLSEAIDREYVRADQLAISNQKQSDRLFKAFGLMAGTMGLLFLVYAKIAALKIFLVGYVLLFAAGFLMFMLSARKGWFGRHLVYRALAETLRTRFFLVLSGAGDRIDTNRVLSLTSIDHFNGFEWLRDAIRCSAPLAYESGVAAGVRLEAARERWVTDQSGYFERKLHALHHQHERLEKVKMWLFAGSFLGALALIFFKKSIVHFDAGGLDGKTLLVFMMGLLPLWLAVWELYQNKMATRELLWQYSNQREFFRKAEARLVAADDDEAKLQITADLAERSLMEIFQWTIHRFHRELEPPAVG
jgi:hypothetical protein